MAYRTRLQLHILLKSPEKDRLQVLSCVAKNVRNKNQGKLLRVRRRYFSWLRIPQSRYILKMFFMVPFYVFSKACLKLFLSQYHPSQFQRSVYQTGKQMLQGILLQDKEESFLQAIQEPDDASHKLFFIPIPLLTIPAECVPNGKTDVAGILLQDKEASFLQAIQEPDDASHKALLLSEYHPPHNSDGVCTKQENRCYRGFSLQDKVESFLQAIREPDDASREGCYHHDFICRSKRSDTAQGEEHRKDRFGVLTKLRE
ncbi:hypothetical protein CDAR_471041 [Caerostris darwini]|uniref:Uncharacterized protein n=1 Tax=Caerostris darwini TaxID=1538125 RepID=A0AAV4N185_9ARAC|nr:hypothetical protein CDAR_471041 [Caerostris darwini]